MQQRLRFPDPAEESDGAWEMMESELKNHITAWVCENVRSQRVQIVCHDGIIFNFGLTAVLAMYISKEVNSSSDDGEVGHVSSDDEAGDRSSINRWLWRFLFIKQHRKAGSYMSMCEW